MFPYSLLAMAVLMYLPALIWRQLVMPSLGSDLLFITDELDKSYNRSIRMAQNILDMRQNTNNPLTFQAELQRYEGGGVINVSFQFYFQNKLYIPSLGEFSSRQHNLLFGSLLLGPVDCKLPPKEMNYSPFLECKVFSLGLFLSGST